MTERGIPLTGQEVRAILDGRQTQVRRVMKPQPDSSLDYLRRSVARFKCTGTVVRTGRDEWQADDANGQPVNCFPDGKHSVKAEIPFPYGQPGDPLYVRETWADVNRASVVPLSAHIVYRADYPADERFTFRWTPSIHMPRWASRLSLEITEVRVERLQQITANDCIADGIPSRGMDRDGPNIASALMYIEDYKDLWNALNEKRGFGWDVNPFVWVIAFRVLESRGSHG